MIKKKKESRVLKEKIAQRRQTVSQSEFIQFLLGCFSPIE